MIWSAKPYVWAGIPPAQTVYEYLFTWDVGAEILAEALEKWLEKFPNNSQVVEKR